jgi:hypothetical protein
MEPIIETNPTSSELPALQPANTPKDLIEAGAWIGRQQAFAAIASKCAAAQARALKEIKEARYYDSLDVNWADFCEQYAGISRSWADTIISRLDELGDNYFRLCEIAQISPDTYRQISGHVTPESIELDGESVPLTRSNSARIRAALKRLRGELASARGEKSEADPTLDEMIRKFDLFLNEVQQLRRHWTGTDRNNDILVLAHHLMKSVVIHYDSVGEQFDLLNFDEDEPGDPEENQEQ